MKNGNRVRIGTRESALALYQAHEVQRILKQNGTEAEIIEITSDGDIDLETPLYEMGIQGIFTKSLDAALLQNKIDVAVHSCKDIPTKLAKGLLLSAILKRGPFLDCLVLKNGRTREVSRTIATSSLRRKLQWLHLHPDYIIENLRGNIQTRLHKLDQSNWHGAIFAHAALERLAITSHQIQLLDWMLPAPAQGAIAVVCRQEDEELKSICQSIDHPESHMCVQAERDFLAALHGGCAVPIAAHARVHSDKILFKGNVMSLDAKEKCEIELSLDLDQVQQIGKLAAGEILKQGAEKIIKTFRSVA